jgi:hypothetical protein
MTGEYGDGKDGADGDSGGYGDDGSDPHEESAKELADIIGVPPERQADFVNALGAYVEMCIAKHESEEPESEKEAEGEAGGPKKGGIGLILGLKPKK